jgi:hypothetical protein
MRPSLSRPNGAEVPLPTPILNLEIPLPQRKLLSRSQALGFVFGLVSTLVFLAGNRGDGEQFGLISVSLFVAILVAILVHEAGHLFAGRIVGFHFNSIQVGWLSLSFEYGRLTLHVHHGMSASGYASIQIDQIYRLRRRFMFFIAGGPAASILSVVVAVVAVNVFDLHKSWLATPAACLAFVSLLLGLLTLFPMARQGHWSDGARLEMLISSLNKTRRWFCLAALANEHRRGKSPKLWNANWIKGAASVRDSSEDEMSACWLAYLCASDQKRTDVAAGYLERCLELVGFAGETLRDTLMLEAAVFQAWHRDNAGRSATWLSRVKAPGRLPRLLQLRSTIAVNCALRDFESAHTNWREGLALIEKLPATPVRDSLNLSWSEWLAEIRERQLAKTN